jgi:hypothetical protein
MIEIFQAQGVCLIILRTFKLSFGSRVGIAWVWLKVSNGSVSRSQSAKIFHLFETFVILVVFCFVLFRIVLFCFLFSLSLRLSHHDIYCLSSTSQHDIRCKIKKLIGRKETSQRQFTYAVEWMGF